MRMGEVDIFASLGLPGGASDYTISNPSVATSPIVDNTPTQTASGALSDWANVATGFLKTIAGYDIAKTQAEAQVAAAQRGVYYPSGTTYPTATRTVTQIAGSNMTPLLLLGGVAAFAFFALRK